MISITPTRLGELRSHLGTVEVAAIHILAAVAVCIALISGFRPLTTGEQLSVAATTLIVTLLAALRITTSVEGGHRGVALWRIGPWFLIWAIPGFGIASFTWLTTQEGTSAIIQQQSVVTALYAVTVAIVVLTASYAVGPPDIVVTTIRRLLRFSLQGKEATLSSRKVVPWMLYSIGIASRLLSLILQGSFGYLGDPTSAVKSATSYNQALTMGSTLATAGLALAAFNFFSRRVKGSGSTLAVLLVVEAAFAMISGNKEPFVVAGLALLVPYGVVKQRLPVKALTIGVLAFLLIVLPFNATYRATIRSSSGTLSATEAIVQAPKLFGDAVQAGGWSTVLADSYDTLLHRIRLIDGMAIIVQKTPSSIPYSSPAEYFYAPAIGVVPRAVWPDKPVLTAGYNFSQDYYELPSSIFTSSTPTTLGGFYQHGGWLVLIMCSWVFGGFLRTLDKVFRGEIDPRAIFFLIATLPTLVKSEVDSVELVISVPMLFLTGVLAARLASDKVRR